MSTAIASAPGSRVLVLDTETTGFSAERDRIVELAAVEVDPRTGASGAQLHRLINPRRAIPAQTVAIHGITNARVAHEPEFHAVAGEVAAFLRGATLAIHNSAFDVRMLDAELARAGAPPLAQLGVRIVDTLEVARGVYPLLPKHTLDALCDRLKVSRARRELHGALVDVQLLAAVLPRMARDYDAWTPAQDDGESDALLRFAARLERVVQTCSNTFRGVTTVLHWIAAQQKAIESRCEALAGGDGIACAHYAASWRESERVSHKEAAQALLSPRDLAAYKHETRTTFVTAAEDERVRCALRPLEAQLAAQTGLHETFALRALLNRAHGTLDDVRARLRAEIFTARQSGFTPEGVTICDRAGARTDYTAALRECAPGADLSAYTHRTSGLRVRERSREPAAHLFGAASIVSPAA